MAKAAALCLLASLSAVQAFHPPERVGAGSVRTLARPPGPLDHLEHGRAATRRKASDVDLAEALAGNETDGAEVSAESEKNLLPFVLGAGALSAATYGLYLSFVETHAPGLAISALCLFGCWAALASRALA